MLTKKAKLLLKWLIQNEKLLSPDDGKKYVSDLIYDHFKDDEIVNCIYSLMEENCITVSTGKPCFESHGTFYLPEEQMYHRARSIKITQFGKDYKELERKKLTYLLLKSILIPILVSVLTSTILFFVQKLFNIEKQPEGRIVPFDYRLNTTTVIEDCFEFLAVPQNLPLEDIADI